MNSIQKKNIIKRDNTSVNLPYDDIDKINHCGPSKQMTVADVNNTFRQLLDNDIYIEKKLKTIADTKYGPKDIGIQQLDNKPDGYKIYGNLVGTDHVEILRKVEDPLSSSITESLVQTGEVTSLFQFDGLTYAICRNGVYSNKDPQVYGWTKISGVDNTNGSFVDKELGYLFVACDDGVYVLSSYIDNEYKKDEDGNIVGVSDTYGQTIRNFVRIAATKSPATALFVNGKTGLIRIGHTGGVDECSFSPLSKNPFQKDSLIPNGLLTKNLNDGTVTTIKEFKSDYSRVNAVLGTTNGLMTSVTENQFSNSDTIHIDSAQVINCECEFRGGVVFGTESGVVSENITLPEQAHTIGNTHKMTSCGDILFSLVGKDVIYKITGDNVSEFKQIQLQELETIKNIRAYGQFLFVCTSTRVIVYNVFKSFVSSVILNGNSIDDIYMYDNTIIYQSNGKIYWSKIIVGTSEENAIIERIVKSDIDVDESWGRFIKAVQCQKRLILVFENHVMDHQSMDINSSLGDSRSIDACTLTILGQEKIAILCEDKILVGYPDENIPFVQEMIFDVNKETQYVRIVSTRNSVVMLNSSGRIGFINVQDNADNDVHEISGNFTTMESDGNSFVAYDSDNTIKYFSDEIEFGNFNDTPEYISAGTTVVAISKSDNLGMYFIQYENGALSSISAVPIVDETHDDASDGQDQDESHNLEYRYNPVLSVNMMNVKHDDSSGFLKTIAKTETEDEIAFFLKDGKVNIYTLSSNGSFVEPVNVSINDHVNDIYQSNDGDVFFLSRSGIYSFHYGYILSAVESEPVNLNATSVMFVDNGSESDSGVMMDFVWDENGVSVQIGDDTYNIIQNDNHTLEDVKIYADDIDCTMVVRDSESGYSIKLFKLNQLANLKSDEYGELTPQEIYIRDDINDISPIGKDLVAIQKPNGDIVEYDVDWTQETVNDSGIQIQGRNIKMFFSPINMTTSFRRTTEDGDFQYFVIEDGNDIELVSTDKDYGFFHVVDRSNFIVKDGEDFVSVRKVGDSDHIKTTQVWNTGNSNVVSMTNIQDTIYWIDDSNMIFSFDVKSGNKQTVYDGNGVRFSGIRSSNETMDVILWDDGNRVYRIHYDEFIDGFYNLLENFIITECEGGIQDILLFEDTNLKYFINFDDSDLPDEQVGDLEDEYDSVLDDDGYSYDIFQDFIGSQIGDMAILSKTGGIKCQLYSNKMVNIGEYKVDDVRKIVSFGRYEFIITNGGDVYETESRGIKVLQNVIDMYVAGKLIFVIFDDDARTVKYGFDIENLSPAQFDNSGEDIRIFGNEKTGFVIPVGMNSPSYNMEFSSLCYVHGVSSIRRILNAGPCQPVDSERFLVDSEIVYIPCNGVVLQCDLNVGRTLGQIQIAENVEFDDAHIYRYGGRITVIYRKGSEIGYSYDFGEPNVVDDSQFPDRIFVIGGKIVRIYRDQIKYKVSDGIESGNVYSIVDQDVNSLYSKDEDGEEIINDLSIRNILLVDDDKAFFSRGNLLMRYTHSGLKAVGEFDDDMTLWEYAHGYLMLIGNTLKSSKDCRHWIHNMDIPTWVVDRGVTDVLIRDRRSYFFGTQDSVLKTTNQYHLEDDVITYNRQDVQDIYYDTLSSDGGISSTVETTMGNHMIDFHESGIIKDINDNYVSSDGSIDLGWQKTITGNGSTYIMNDTIQDIEFGDFNSGDVRINTWNFLMDRDKFLESTDFTYIKKRWMSGITELIINIPTTNTYYLANVYGAADCIRRPDQKYNRKNLAKFGQEKMFQNSVLMEHTTDIYVSLDNSEFHIDKMIEVQINGNSLPLGIYKDKSTFGSIGTSGNMFRSFIQPSVFRNCDEYDEDLSDTTFRFSCFGSDSQSIRIVFMDNRIQSSKKRLIVKYDSNGGIGTMRKQWFVFDDDETTISRRQLRKCTFQKNDVQFAGWSLSRREDNYSSTTSEYDGSQVYGEQQKFPYNGSIDDIVNELKLNDDNVQKKRIEITLYAVWNRYTIGETDNRFEIRSTGDNFYIDSVGIDTTSSLGDNVAIKM